MSLWDAEKCKLLTCDDLLYDDVKKLLAEVDKTFKDIVEEFTAKGLVQNGVRESPELHEIRLFYYGIKGK